jgi:serine/threonine-protein kinase
MTIAIGTRLGRYEIRSPLGAGGMGEVYLAQDTKLDRKVALKVLPADVAADRHRMSRFVQEAKAASALNHPDIITIYEIEQIDSVHFIATEFIDGVTLRDRLRNASMKLGEALDVATQMASALAAAHSAGIVHRDVKPENVMLRRDGIVKVLDFGLAKLTAQAGETSVVTEAATPGLNTEPGVVMGTAIYMSPEQARGIDVDARTDIFSLGVVIYEMLAGRLPFQGSNTNEILASILGDNDPPPLARYATEVPVELERIVAKALRKDRDERYQTIKDLLLDLQRLKQEAEFERKLERSASPKSKSRLETREPEGAEIVMGSAARSTLSERGLTSAMTLKERRAVIVVAALLIIASAVGGYFYFTRARGGVIDSIAVLPFQNTSADADTEYLADGLAESLIYRLSQLPNLRVSPTSSVFRYKGKDTDPQVIAKTLGVDSVMTARIAQRGDNLTISINLVDARHNRSLWGEQYERKMSELLVTQRDIAAEITKKLQLTLSGGEGWLTKRYTDNNEAYQLYLKGRYHYAKRTKEDILKGIEYFQQAINLDPNFALAYAMVADSYVSLPAYAYLSSKAAAPQAMSAAKRAIEIEPTLAEGHTSLAYSLAVYDWNWAEAQREFKRGIELAPNNAAAHFRYGQIYLPAMGRWDEAIAKVKRALEMEPLNLVMNTNLVMVYRCAGQYDRALEHAKNTYDLDETFILSGVELAGAYAAKGMYAEAIELYEKGVLADPTNQLPLVGLGSAYAKAGRRHDAEKLITRFKDIAQTQPVLSSRIALIYASLGDKDKAFAEFDKAIEQREFYLHRLKCDQTSNPLRDDPRYKAMLKRLNLPE